MPDPTEAEARAAVDELEAFIESFSRGLYERLNALGEYAKELGRATEREKVRALIEGLAEEMLNTVDGEWECFYCAGIAHYFSPFDLYIDHIEDCPWVEARLWLARDEVPE